MQRDYFIIPLLHGILKVSRKSGQLITEHAVLESYARLSSTLINEATEGESTLASDFTPTVHNQCSNPHLFTFISTPVLRIQHVCVCVCLCVFPSRGDQGVTGGSGNMPCIPCPLQNPEQRALEK